jgi:hypothetical protein
MSDSHSRLAAASAAWTRLFRNTRPTITQQQKANNSNKAHRSRNDNDARTTPAKQHQSNIQQPAHFTQPTRSHQVQPAIALHQDNINHEMQRNTAWGDTMEAKATDITRIYCQNVNGLRLDQDGGQFHEICKVHQEVQADIIL